MTLHAAMAQGVLGPRDHDVPYGHGMSNLIITNLYHGNQQKPGTSRISDCSYPKTLGTM